MRSTSDTVYMDYAATTPVDPRVVARMLEFLGPRALFANAASRGHAAGRRAAAAVEDARAQVAALLGCAAEEVIWTSGATEAINLALKGVVRAARVRSPHLITGRTEHRAVLDTFAALQREGCSITCLEPGADGAVTADAVASALRPETLLVSLMHVNNETGAICDLAAVGAVTRARGVLLHVDAAQSAGRIPLDVSAMNADLLSLSGHKLYAPKGVGALYRRGFPRIALEPLLHGGGQERGYRPGTVPVHQVVALGMACALAAESLQAEQARLRALRERLWYGLAALGAVERNGPAAGGAPHILNVSLLDVDAGSVLAAVPGLALATGSACTSAHSTPSHVLMAMGLPPARQRSAVRLSLGRWTSAAEVEAAVAAVGEAVVHLRAISPLWAARQRGEDPEAMWQAGA